MDERFNPSRERQTGERSPADLRRVLGRIYPEEMLDELMEKLGFTEKHDSEIDFDYAAEDV